MRNPQIEELFSGLSRNSIFQSLAGRIASAADPALFRLSGLTLTARAIYTVLLHAATRRPQLFIVDGNKQAEAIFPLLRTFSDLINPGNAPLLLPALDVLPGQAMSPHAEILAVRAAALCQLAAGFTGITVLPVTAALARMEAPAYYRQLAQVLRVKDEVPLDDLALHLESVGYERNDPVEMAGQYSIRGGILDVFPPEQEQPVRIEFFGDEIESIRRFDAATQRSIHKLNECELLPLTEFQRSRPVLAALADHLRERGIRSRELPVNGEPFAGWESVLPAVRPRGSSLSSLSTNRR
jgi:transcription-repair coupling factor (superfamily II helicase)